jgi:hypothetical protein
MSIETYTQVAVNAYANDGRRVDEDSVEVYETRPVVDVMGEHVELHTTASIDHKDSPLELMSQVNEALERMGVELRFVHVDRGDDSYTFGVEDI